MRLFKNFYTTSFFLLITGSQVVAAEKGDSSAAAQTATTAAKTVVQNYALSRFTNSGALFRYRLGEVTGRSLAAGDESEFVSTTFSMTPTYSSINNSVQPIFVKGGVSLVILGLERFDELELKATGITLTIDKTSVDVSQASISGITKAKGDGFTLAPYHVFELPVGYLIDVSAGIGKNKLLTVSSTATASPTADRAFVSIGGSKIVAMGQASQIQYKGTLSYSMDDVNAYVQSDGTAVAKNSTRMRQVSVATIFTKRMELISPFIGVALNSNQLTTRGDGVQPREHKNTAVLSTGLNFAKEKLYGNVTYMKERDKHNVQLYLGLRY
jgi:hypothetical protein